MDQSINSTAHYIILGPHTMLFNTFMQRLTRVKYAIETNTDVGDFMSDISKTCLTIRQETYLKKVAPICHVNNTRI